MLSGVFHDLRFGVRSLAKSPLLTGVAVLSIALGIGSNTAIFSLFDQVLIRTLPVDDPEELVLIHTEGSHVGSNRGPRMLSYPMFEDYREQNEVFSGVLCRRAIVVNIGLGGGAERTDAELVSGHYFQVLGVRPALGRTFTMADERDFGQDPVAVLSHDYWRQRFEGDPGVLGSAILLNGHPVTIVGVAAPGFDGLTLGFSPKLFVPVTMARQALPSWGDVFEDRRTRWVQVFARLDEGVAMATAEASIRTLHKEIIRLESQEDYFDDVTEYGRQRFLESHAVLYPGAQGYSSMRRRLETPLKVLMGFVGLLLLITCANVSNLLVARAISRQKEVAMRLAVGAGKRHIVRQLLVESFLLAVAGGVAGVLLGYLSLEALVRLAPDEQQLALSTLPDTRVLGFCFAISTLAALVFGLVPALQAGSTNLVAMLKLGIGGAASGRGARLRRSLVVIQVVVALLLVLGSALFVQSLRNLNAVEPGFEATNLVRFKLDPMLSGYDVARTKDFYERLRQRLGQLPGVSSVGLAVVAIMEGDEWDSSVTVEGYRAADGEDMNPHFNSVSPGYFDTMGIVVREGRDFDERDTEGAKEVVVVNETFARKYFDGESPVGYHMAFGSGPSVVPDIEIVGVVEDAKYEDLRDEVPRQVFVAYQQPEWASQMTAYVRTVKPSDAVFADIRSVVSEMDGSIPIFDMNTMEDQLDRSLAVERMVAFLSSAFGALAATLAFVGLYGVTAYSVTRRSAEIGLRMALGAHGRLVIEMVLREVLLLTAAGVALAVPAAWWLGELVSTQLYGIAPRDPGSFALAIFGLIAVTVLAGLVPALRASRLDPVRVLRTE